MPVKDETEGRIFPKSVVATLLTSGLLLLFVVAFFLIYV